jgi:hypothetical protein
MRRRHRQLANTAASVDEVRPGQVEEQHGGRRSRFGGGRGGGGGRAGVTGSRGSPIGALHGSSARAEEHDGDGLYHRPMAPVD